MFVPVTAAAHVLLYSAIGFASSHVLALSSLGCVLCLHDQGVVKFHVESRQTQHHA
jgi:hypothetical protein